MAIFRPTALGGLVIALDSDSISNELNINDSTYGNITVSSKVWNIGVGSYFTLTASSASLVTDQILAVLGYDGLRWIVDSSAASSVTLSGAGVAGKTAGGSGASGTLGFVALIGAIFAANTSTVNTVTGGNKVVISGLDGNNDGDYMMTFDLDCSTNAPGAITAKINDVTTNQTSGISYVFGSGGGTVVGPGMTLWNSASTGRLTGVIYMTAKTGKQRSFFAATADGASNLVITVGTYANTGTNITSFTINAANANAFDAAIVKVTKTGRMG